MYALEAYLEFLTAMLLAITPAVLFIAFYRGLMAMRDDQLIQQLADELEELPGRNDETVSAPRHGGLATHDSTSTAAVQCPNCGARNDPVADYCHDCLSEV